MTVHTVSSLRATHRRLAKRAGRLEKADAVLAKMCAGATLNLFYAKQRRWWTLRPARKFTATSPQWSSPTGRSSAWAITCSASASRRLGATSGATPPDPAHNKRPPPRLAAGSGGQVKFRNI
jgi:hypothetical protein